jgi:hypothetical protein
MASDYARRRRSTYRAWPHCPTDPEATPNSATPQQPRSPPPTPGRCARRTTPPGLPARARAHRHTRQTQPIPHRPRRQRHVVRAGRTAPPTGGRSLHHLAQAHLPALTRGSAAAPSSAPTSFGGGQAGQRVSSTSAPVPVPRHAGTVPTPTNRTASAATPAGLPRTAVTARTTPSRRSLLHRPQTSRGGGMGANQIVRRRQRLGSQPRHKQRTSGYRHRVIAKPGQGVDSPP